MRGGICRATYDAEIRVGTKVDTSQMQRLQLQIDKATKKAEELQREYDELSQKQIPTDAYKKLEDSLSKTKIKLDELITEEEKMASDGLAIGAPWDNVLQKEADAQLKIEAIQAEMQELVDTGKAFTVGANPEELNKTANDLAKAKAELRMLVTKQNELNGSTGKLSDRLRKIGTAASKAFTALDKGVTKVFTAIKDRAKSAFSTVRKETGKTNGLLATMKSRLQGIALSLLVFNWISKGFNAMVAGMKEGFKNLVKYSDEYNASMSRLISANAQLKNSLAAAFAPLVSVVIPYLVSFINMLSAAATKVAEFIAALTGKSVFLRATKQLKDYRKELGGTAAAAKKAAGQLAAFDKLNVVRQDKDDSSGSDGDDGGSGAGFEEVPVSDEMRKLAEKLKDILKKIFDPLKKAWNRVGKRVMQAWKYALDEVWALVKDIGRDFLIMWNQEATIMMFEDILRIIMHIGYTIGNLARQFRKAWNTNDVGLHIFENIRDILAIIIHNIQVAAAYTALWAGNLDFYPLLERFSGWLESLKPVAEAVSGILLDFYTKVILPLGEWVIEKGLPDLLQVFIDFNNKVDWDGLRADLAELWAHLEPFAETVGEGLIVFIRELSNKIAEFTESQTFKDMLSWLEEKMDSTTPQDIADGLWKIIKVFIAIKVGAACLKVSTPIIKAFFDLFGKDIAEKILDGSGAIGKFAAALGDLAIATAGALAVAEPLKSLFAVIADITGNQEMADRLRGEYDGVAGTFHMVGDAAETVWNKLNNLPAAMNGAENSSYALDSAMKQIADGAIYTDEQMAKIQDKWKLSAEDMEMLRQAMLDANPALRDVADGFGLVDASAQTLTNVYMATADMRDGFIDSSVAAAAMKNDLMEVTDEAGQFIDNLHSGKVSLSEYQTELLNTSGYTTNFGNEMKEAGDKSGKSFASNLKKGVGDIQKLTLGFGANAVAGFNSGILQNMPSTDKTIGAWSNSGVNALHDSVWVYGSPSKKAEEFGKNTVVGYNQGITNSIQRSVTVIKNWMKAIESTFKGIVQVMANIGKDSMSALIDGLTSRQEELQKKVEELAEKSKSVGTSAGSGGSKGGGRSTTKSMSTTGLPRLTTESIVRGGNPYIIMAQAKGQSVTGLSASAIKQAVSDAIRDNAKAFGGDMTVTVPLDGREIYRNTVRRDQIFRKSTGHSAFEGV